MYTEKAMARDYYPLIARAIASLEQNTAETRQVVYDHARRVLRDRCAISHPLSPYRNEWTSCSRSRRRISDMAPRPFTGRSARQAPDAVSPWQRPKGIGFGPSQP